MGYCFSCGKLRDTSGGLCRQCAIDEYVRKRNAERNERVRLKIDTAKAKRGDSDGKP